MLTLKAKEDIQNADLELKRNSIMDITNRKILHLVISGPVDVEKTLQQTKNSMETFKMVKVF